MHASYPQLHHVGRVSPHKRNQGTTALCCCATNQVPKVGGHIGQREFSLHERQICLTKDPMIQSQKQEKKHLHKSMGDQEIFGQTELARRNRWTGRCCLNSPFLLTTAFKTLIGFILETCTASAAVHDSRVQVTNLLTLSASWCGLAICHRTLYQSGPRIHQGRTKGRRNESRPGTLSFRTLLVCLVG